MAHPQPDGEEIKRLTGSYQHVYQIVGRYAACPPDSRRNVNDIPFPIQPLIVRDLLFVCRQFVEYRPPHVALCPTVIAVITRGIRPATLRQIPPGQPVLST